ncbi:hypothetical protein [Microbacterium lacus]|uniref:phage terminase small subunit n=1 Tax=Microbacterium lacus TaxID=415217 RepID=UPI0018E1F650|nr:hypothetical protein [Microbacterium lacus]
MAGNGPPANPTRSRSRDTVVRDMIKSDGKIGGFDLPDDVLPVDKETGEREQWHPQTVRWWNNFRESPQGTRMVTAVDWDYLLDTALMHHVSWMSGGKNSERFAEIRIRVAAFGATPADRMRLRQEIELPPEQYPAGDGTSPNITSINDRRERLTGS